MRYRSKGAAPAKGGGNRKIRCDGYSPNARSQRGQTIGESRATVQAPTRGPSLAHRRPHRAQPQWPHSHLRRFAHTIAFVRDPARTEERLAPMGTASRAIGQPVRNPVATFPLVVSGPCQSLELRPATPAPPCSEPRPPPNHLWPLDWPRTETAIVAYLLGRSRPNGSSRHRRLRRRHGWRFRGRSSMGVQLRLTRGGGAG